MFKHGFPPEWSTFKKLIWLVGSGIAGGASGIWKTVTGTLIHITDALASPMQKCEVTLEPIQDLHGQDAPYPAGGGKNKFQTDFENTTKNGTVITKNSDGTVTTTNAPSASFDFVIGHVPLKAGDYILNGCPDGGGATKYRLQVTDYPVTSNLGQDSGSGVSFTLANDMEVAVRIQIYTGASASLLFKPMIRLSSVTDNTFAPYSNICPITGWTGCEVNRTGVNVWDEEWELGAFDDNTGEPYSANAIRSKNYIPVKSGETLRFINGGADVYAKFVYYDASKNVVQVVKNTISNNKTFEIPSGIYYIRFNMSSGYGTTYNHDISINYPSTDTDYHAYSGTTLSVTFPETVYGGTHEFVSGGLKPYKEYDSYNGETLTGEWMSSMDKYVAGTTPTIGAQVVDLDGYDTTVQLTPQPISTLKGVNNVWSNSNGATTVIYKAQAE